MTIAPEFIASWEYLDPKVVLELMTSTDRPKGGQIWALTNEIRPVDLYCYLGSRFGSPNGFQNFLRRDDSDNLIHWEWTFRCAHGLLSFLGMNFRTEIQLIGDFLLEEADKEEFVQQIKADFANYGAKMSQLRKARLEDWIEFANPYQRLRRA